MAKKPKSISVTKLDAVRRQIEAAVALWFEDGDPVAIHTLTAAAHRVCHDLLTKAGDTTMVFNMAMLSEEDGRKSGRLAGPGLTRRSGWACATTGTN